MVEIAPTVRKLQYFPKFKMTSTAVMVVVIVKRAHAAAVQNVGLPLLYDFNGWTNNRQALSLTYCRDA